VKKSFSLIEVSIVIVILSIISLANYQTISTFYNNIQISKNLNKNSYELNITLNIISKRLNNSFKQSIYYDNQEDALMFIGIEDEAYRGYKHKNINFNYGNSSILDMASYDKDKKTILTLDYDFINTYQTIKDIHKAKLTSYKNIVMIFDIPYTLHDLWSNSGKLHQVKCYDKKCKTNQLIFKHKISTKLSEHYYLSSSAYSIQLENHNLFLYKNFKPWIGQTYKKGEKILLSKNINSISYKNNIVKVCNYNICLSEVIK
jgi:prepilin-type N-terminal cleavage/methylation domain-containing protein